MKHQTLVMGSILAAGIVAIVVCVGMAMGFPLANPLHIGAAFPSGPYIHVDPVADRTTGDLLIVKGTTNLPPDTTLMVEVGNYGGNTEVRNSSSSANWFSMPVDTSVIKPGTYTIKVIKMKGDPAKGDYGPTNLNGTTSFTLNGAYLTTDTPVQATITGSDFIKIDPIGDRSSGDPFLITGTTSLPVGTAVIWQVSPPSFLTNPNQTGSATGMMATTQVTKGKGDTNRVSFAVDTNSLLPDQYYVTVSTGIGNLSQEFKPEGLTGSATFNILSGTGSMQSQGPDSSGYITVDPISPKTTSDLVLVTGSTNLAAGTSLMVSAGNWGGNTVVNAGTGGTNRYPCRWILPPFIPVPRLLT